MLNIVVNLFSKKTDINCYSNLIKPVFNSYFFEFKDELLNEWIVFVFDRINEIKNNLSINLNQIIFSIENIRNFNQNILKKIKIVFQEILNIKVNIIDYFELVSDSTNIENGYIVYFGFQTHFVKINNYKNIKNINLKKHNLNYLSYEYISKKLLNYFLNIDKKNSNLFIKFKNDFNINSIEELNVNEFVIVEWLTKESQIVQEKFIINDIKKVLINLVKFAEKKDTNIYVICDFKNNDLILKILKRYFLIKEKCIFLV